MKGVTRAVFEPEKTNADKGLTSDTYIMQFMKRLKYQGWLKISSFFAENKFAFA